MMNNKGFSLIEVLVTSAIIGGSIIAAARMYADQTKKEKTMEIALTSRVILSSIHNEISQNSNRYPAIFESQNDIFSLSYVRCFNSSGKAIPNTSGQNKYVVVKIDEVPQVGPELIKTGDCEANRDYYEVHITYSSAGEVYIDTLPTFKNKFVLREFYRFKGPILNAF